MAPGCSTATTSASDTCLPGTLAGYGRGARRLNLRRSRSSPDARRVGLGGERIGLGGVARLLPGEDALVEDRRVRVAALAELVDDGARGVVRARAIREDPRA